MVSLIYLLIHTTNISLKLDTVLFPYFSETSFTLLRGDILAGEETLFFFKALSIMSKISLKVKPTQGMGKIKSKQAKDYRG